MPRQGALPFRMTDRVEPPPSTKIVRAIEERSLRAWPAFETRPCRGWQVRYAEGYTKRANSANAVEPSARFGVVKPLAEIFYRAHRQPVIFRLTPLSGDDAEPLLVRSGYERIDPTQVMIAKLPPPASEDGRQPAGLARAGLVDRVRQRRRAHPVTA